jgi:hypothetical protein
LAAAADTIDTMNGVNSRHFNLREELMDTKITAAYCRTATADEWTIAEQERIIREYADRHGYGEPAFYRDCGQSGATLDRPAMNTLTMDVKAWKVGAVIAANTARIARNYALFSEWLDLMDEYGVAFVTLTDGEIASGKRISYRLVGDYYLPLIALSDPPDATPLGLYGELHKRYLAEHRPILYNWLLLQEKLYPLCREVDQTARERKRRGVSEEVILSELVYA